MSGITQEDLPLEIWLEIFRYATYTSYSISRTDPFIPEVAITNIMGFNTPFSSMQTKCNLVLVCRSWRHVAIEVLYEHIAIRSPQRANLILTTLQGVAQQQQAEEGTSVQGVNSSLNPSQNINLGYGRWTRSIEVHTLARGGKSVRFIECVFHILQHCPNVRMLKCHWNWVVPQAFLESLARMYGQTIKNLSWNGAATPTSKSTWAAAPEFLGAFQSLRVLDIRNIAEFDLSTRPITSSKPTLPHVRELLLADTIASFAVATALNLPAFHRLSVEFIKRQTDLRTQVFRVVGYFLEAHGPRITQLEIVSFPFTWGYTNADMFLRSGVCPNLQDLVFHENQPLLDSMSEPHPTLRRIGLRGVTTDKLYPDKTSTVTEHLHSFMSGMFPALEVVRTVSYLVDASVDSLARDIFIWWADRFERYGIDFQDGEGVLWMYTDIDESATKTTGEDAPSGPIYYEVTTSPDSM